MLEAVRSAETSENIRNSTCSISKRQGRTHRGAAAPPPKTPQNRNLKPTDIVDIMTSKVLRDLPFSRNQQLKTADDWYSEILKNKLIKLKKKTICH
jgi:hypothetical protein